MSSQPIPYKKWAQRALVDQIYFYSDLTDTLQKAKLSMKLGKSDVSMRTEDLANGDVKVSVTIPLDTNRDAKDGRLYVKDEFVLEGQGLKVKSFQRNFSYNGKGSEKWWVSQKDRLQKTARPGSSAQQEFSHKIFSKHRVISQLFGPGKAGLDYLTKIGTTAQGVYDQFSVKIPVADTYATVIKTGGRYLIKFAWVIDDDKNTSNGSVLMEDYFKIDATTKDLKTHLRRWSVHPDSKGNATSDAHVSKLNRTKKPSKDDSEKFLAAVLPALFSTKKTTNSSPPLAKAAPVKTPSPGSIYTGLPKPVVVGPRYKSDPVPEPKGPSWAWGFSSPPRGLDRNAKEDNMKQTVVKKIVQPYMFKHFRGKLSKLKFTVRVYFDKDTGYVTKVQFAEVEKSGSMLNRNIKPLLMGLAQDIHRRVRAEKGYPHPWYGAPLSIVFAN